MFQSLKSAKAELKFVYNTSLKSSVYTGQTTLQSALASSIMLADAVLETGSILGLPSMIYEGINGEVCIDYVGNGKIATVVCDVTDIRADYLAGSTVGSWHAKKASDGIADLMTLVFQFIS